MVLGGVPLTDIIDSSREVENAEQDQTAHLCRLILLYTLRKNQCMVAYNGQDKGSSLCISFQDLTEIEISLVVDFISALIRFYRHNWPYGLNDRAPFQRSSS